MSASSDGRGRGAPCQISVYEKIVDTRMLEWLLAWAAQGLLHHNRSASAASVLCDLKELQADIAWADSLPAEPRGVR